MKKSLALILGLCIFLSACTAGNPTETIGDPTLPPTSSQTTATTAPAETGGADETAEPSVPDSTQASESSEPTEATHPAATVPSNKEDTDTPKQTEPKETEPPATTQPSTDPPETQPSETKPPETQPSETKPPETKPEKTETPATDPSVTEPPTTNPSETEPQECQHDWLCVHHQEEGHWIAGIICDCGWKVYGESAQLISLWNAHSMSFPTAESLFNHGGYGCVDEWIVDKPAYDEWKCRLCSKPKE